MFFRLVLLLLLAIVVLTAIRMFAGIITKGVGAFFDPPKPGPGPSKPPPSASGGELKRDPVCGTFVAAATSLKTTVHGETFYFCSTECRDKYRRG